jgi:hypothetical protein
MRVFAGSGSSEDLIQLVIRSQPKLVMNRREYAIAKNLALAGRTERLREIFHELARDLARTSVRYWLDYLGVEPGKSGRPKKASFTDCEAYMVGQTVEEERERFDPLFKLKSRLSHADLLRQLRAKNISPAEIDIIFASRNAKTAACKKTSTRCSRSLKTVSKYYLEYQRNRPGN